MVDIETNPLYYAATGGIIIGIATSIHYVLKGNVTGMSGILYGIISLDKNDLHNKLSIVGGIIFASAFLFNIFGYGTYNKFTPFGPEPQITEYTSYLGYALAGLLVGFGTKLGNGCTSGHGLCGLARLSIRSFVAVLVFLFSAISIGTIRYYVTLGPFTDQQLNPQLDYQHTFSSLIMLALGVILFGTGMIIQYKNYSQKTVSEIFRENIISWIVGFIFSTGLIVAGMCRRRNILQFLWMGVDWNPSLLFVLGCGVMVNLLVFQYMIRVRKVPFYGQKLFNPNNSKIDWKLIVGALSFGLGWGIGGLCPGPAMALIPVFTLQIHVVWFACVILGMILANKLNQMTTGTSTAHVSSLQQQIKKGEIDVNKMMQSSQINLKHKCSHTEQNKEPIKEKKIQITKFQQIKEDQSPQQ